MPVHFAYSVVFAVGEYGEPELPTKVDRPDSAYQPPNV